MGILDTLFNRQRTVQVNPPSDPSSTLGQADTLPAVPTTITDKIAAGGNAVIDKATEIYNKNPKLVGGLALLAGVALLTGMKRRGRI